MIQTYPIRWIAEGISMGFMGLCLWPVAMGMFILWRFYRMSILYEDWDE